MRVCILGWYGTETLGDRAILDGIVRIYSAAYSEISISIGSLYPFVTERTLFEDRALYNEYTKDLEINTFDVRDKKVLLHEIKKSDHVIMGGGPLMDLAELYIIKYAFKESKKMKKATALLGCGYGPLIKKEFINCVKQIVELSDIVIMRSSQCLEQIKSISSKNFWGKLYYLMDPAVVSVLNYKKNYLEKLNGFNDKKKKSTWIINIRDLDYVNNRKNEYYPKIRDLVQIISEQVTNLTLIPMHSFSVGGDDRIIQNRISQDLNDPKINVIQKPLNLKEAYNLIFESEGCIGMRYHSILFQTFLNGNNYIIDYTNPQTGKISSFIKEIDKDSFYADRYMHIDDDFETRSIKIKNTISNFIFDISIGEKNLERYKELVRNIMENK